MKRPYFKKKDIPLYLWEHFCSSVKSIFCSVSWSCRMHRPLLLPNECPGYDNKQSDCEVLEMLEHLENAEYLIIDIF